MDKKIFVTDITMKLADEETGNRLSFRQKIELAKQLDRLGLSVIELSPILMPKQDSLLVKSLASTVKQSILSIPVDIFNPDSIDSTWSAIQDAVHPRLQVSVPVSTVQMEYLCHKKPEAIINLVRDMVTRCVCVCPDVEFVAEDFGRSDRDFLIDVIKAATEGGATTVTICDTAGTLMEDECFESTKWMREILPSGVRLGVCCSNDIYLADSCSISAVRAGADEVKTTLYGNKTASLKRLVKILHTREDLCHAKCDVKITELSRAVAQMRALCEADRRKQKSILNSDDKALRLTVHDNAETVLKTVAQMGYDLSDEDGKRVYEAVLNLASKKETVEVKELDAIVASVAYQAPPTYTLESYMVSSSNLISPVCHLRLKKGEDVLESVCLGDGPVDAAFLAIDKLVGLDYELDDFQLQSVTEGSEAMGGAIVRLRQGGKVYSGRGVSHDIVCSGILAYLNAVNKIVFEEEATV